MLIFLSLNRISCFLQASLSGRLYYLFKPFSYCLLFLGDTMLFRAAGLGEGFSLHVPFPPPIQSEGSAGSRRRSRSVIISDSRPS